MLSLEIYILFGDNLELSIFRASASVGAFFNFGGIEMKKKVISLIMVIGVVMTFFSNLLVVNVSAAMGDYDGNITGATWCWPLHGFTSEYSAYSKITSSYGYRGGGYDSYHKGMDIGASNGTEVFPTREGTVYLADTSPDGSEGRSVIINHGDGYYSAYYHLSNVNVYGGQWVDTNTQIGSVGGSGYGQDGYYAYHLHFAIHYGSSWNYTCSVNPCPSGYTRIGDSMQESAGGRPIGNASISYSLTTTEPPTQYTSDDIPNGIYSICWKNTNTYISMGNNNTLGYHTIIYEPGKNGDLDSDQKFYFERQNKGTYKIISQRNGMMLEVDSSSLDDEAYIQQWIANGLANQEWYIIRRWDGYYKFINANSKKALDVGSHVQQWIDNDTDAQKFRIESANYTNSCNIKNGIYCIKHKNGLYVSAGNSTEKGYDAIVYEPGKNGCLDEDQKFYFERLPNNAYKITSQRSGQVLEVDTYSFSNEAPIQQWVYDKLPSQEWVIIESGNGYYKFINKHSGKALDVGGRLQQWDDNNTNAQKFKIIPISITITFNPNGGTTPTKNKTVTYQSTYGDLPTPTLKGYRFKGWFTSANGGTQITSETKVTITNNQTLYAQWEKAEYSIKYDANGGTGNIPESSYPIDKNGKITDIEPTRVGYRFLGWSKSKIAKSPTYKANDIYTEKADITLYAVWKILPAINASINKKATYSLISIALSNADEGTSVIISAYKDGRLTDLQIETYDNADLSVATFAEYDTIKIMLWDNIGTMQPMCKPAIIK